jgi:hypothetical protein
MTAPSSKTVFQGDSVEVSVDNDSSAEEVSLDSIADSGEHLHGSPKEMAAECRRWSSRLSEAALELDVCARFLDDLVVAEVR